MSLETVLRVKMYSLLLQSITHQARPAMSSMVMPCNICLTGDLHAEGKTEKERMNDRGKCYRYMEQRKIDKELCMLQHEQEKKQGDRNESIEEERGL